ncbi:MAG: Coq4 family protein [Myxococcaceae bacterium]
MLDSLLASFSRAHAQGAFLLTLLSQVREPSADTALRLEQLATKLARPEDIERYLSAMRSGSGTGPMMAQRFLAPPYMLEDLAHLPEGTLGHAYRRHMLDNGLKADFFAPIEPSDDAAYARLRMYQTHDIWHVVTGYSTSTAGEVSIVGFYLGQFDRYAGPNAHHAMGFTAMLAGTAFMHAALMRPDRMRPFYRGFTEGFTRGQTARSLFAARWEEMWERPLVDIRAEYGVGERAAARASA